MMSELEVLGRRYVFRRMSPNVTTIYALFVWVPSDWMPKNARTVRSDSWAEAALICSRARRLLRSPCRC